MKNKEWYYFDPADSEKGIKLTDKAPPEAVKSYEKFYAESEIREDEDGKEWIET
jgi:hypothetical protein